MIKCSLCEGIMISMIVTHFYNLIYKKEVSGCFITNCVMVVLVQFLSIIMPEIATTARNAKFVKKRHPASLYGYKAEKSKAKQPDGNSSDESKVNVNCATSNTKSDVISMCVVPVFARHKLSNCNVKTYAMLDSCSQATFMRNTILGTLSLHGCKTSVTVKAMDGEVIKSYEVLDGIEVAQASNESEEKIYVQLPSTYTQEDSSVDNREIVTAEKSGNIWIN